MVFSVLQESIWGDPGDVMDIRLIGILLICQIFSSQRAKESQNKNEVWNERAPGVASPRNSPRGSKPSSRLDEALKVISSHFKSFQGHHLALKATFAQDAQPKHFGPWSGAHGSLEPLREATSGSPGKQPFGSTELKGGLQTELKDHLTRGALQFRGSWLQIASLSLQNEPLQISAEEFDILGLSI